jgi:hypothetical protein
MTTALSKDDKDILEYLRFELSAAQVELQAAKTPETKREAGEHFHQMLDEFVLVLCDEDEQDPNP